MEESSISVERSGAAIKAFAGAVTKGVDSEKIVSKCSRAIHVMNGGLDECRILKSKEREKEARSVAADGKDDVDGEVNAGRRTTLQYLYPLSILLKGAVVIITIVMIISSYPNGRVGQCQLDSIRRYVMVPGQGDGRPEAAVPITEK